MIRILNMSEVSRDEIFARAETITSVEDIVTGIIANVRQNGDAALREYCEKFDKVSLDNFRVTDEEIAYALTQVEPEFLNVLREAAKNIRAFHQKQVRQGFVMTEQDGVVLGQKVTPIERVGLYVPGGTAAYPSTVLMDSIPAMIAGCSRIVMVTPPAKNGSVNPAILAAAHIAGITEIYKVGGAQAVAALAYGTESIPRNRDTDFLIVLDYIEKHLAEDITLEDLSEIAHFEKAYLITKFKEIWGLSPMKYVNALRIERAKQLLSTTEKSITDIAYETGFGSIHYFTRYFKDSTGITPSEYRTKNRIR